MTARTLNNHLQSKLLRFLQERVFRRVGGSKDLTSNVRVVSATNRDPASEVKEGRLRTDLYYRLNVIPLELPPLRQREDDIPLLAIHALRAAAARHGKAFATIDPEALEQLNAYAWPGNVRQLYHLLERCVILNDGHTLKHEMLPFEIGRSTIRPTVANAVPQQPQPAPETPNMPPLPPPPSIAATPAWPAETDQIPPELMVPLEEIERRAIIIALRAHSGSPSRAAKSLAISEATIFRKIKTYGLHAPKS